MARDKSRPTSPLRQLDYKLRTPNKTLPPSDMELLIITIEDLIFIGRLVREYELDTPPALRSISTSLRRLLLDGDLNKAANIVEWRDRFTVKARVLDYDDPNPLVIVNCGNCPWGDAYIPSTGSLLGSTSTTQREDMEYSFRDDVELPLKEFLETLAFVITGTKVKRADVISYIANKKAAHVSPNRDRPAHWILDHAWQSLRVTRVDDCGHAETINTVYLELASIAAAIAGSTSINRFIGYVANCIQGAELVAGEEVAKTIGISFPVEPTRIRAEDE